MYRVSLINMPFSNLGMPSIALTQIKAMVQARFQEKVSVEIIYLSHDLAKYLGTDLYGYLTGSMESLNTGLGDWFFRQVAFPDQPDNTNDYLGRYFPARSPELQRLNNWIAQKRPNIDAFLDELVRKYHLDEAQIAGFTSMFMQNAASFGMARKLKQHNPNVITVMGGANCEFPMGEIIAKQIKAVDYVFSGPALKNFPEFVQYSIDGEMEKCAAIRGVFTRSASTSKSGAETIGEDLHIDTPIPLDYKPFLTRLDGYFPNKEVQPILPFETSRGCWWGERAHCTFCGLNGATMGYRAMKPDLAIELFDSLFKYSGKVTRLTAVDNILPKNYIGDVLPFLETPPEMEIFYEVKADLSEEDIAELARAGVKQVQPGIEALATSTLKLMKKGTTVFQNIKLLKLCALYGVYPHWNLLVGFPGEKEDVYRRYVEILPLLAHLCPPSGAYPVRFDRFSPYYYEAQRYGLDLRPLDFYSFVYPFSEEEMKQFAYYFSDKNIMAEYFTTMARWIGKVRAKISRWHALWNNSKQALAPRLYFKEDSTIVYDTRSGSIVQHVVGSAGRRVLQYLSWKPTRIDDLSKEFSFKEDSECAVDISRELTHLREKGLIFQEDDRVMSLVLDGDHGSMRGRYLSRSRPIPKPASSPALIQLA